MGRCHSVTTLRVGTPTTSKSDPIDASLELDEDDDEGSAGGKMGKWNGTGAAAAAIFAFGAERLGRAFFGTVSPNANNVEISKIQVNVHILERQRNWGRRKC